MTPFQYPAAPFIRRHGPLGYSQADGFRPWLRDEFSFRCVYCLDREIWHRREAHFVVDHVRPVSRRPELALKYENLVYACVTCNSAKADKEVPDPSLALHADSVRVEEDGAIVGLTPEACRLIDKLLLDSPAAREFRCKWRRILRLAAEVSPELYTDLSGYPSDLPDLAQLRPPGGNARPAGIRESYFARRERGAGTPSEQEKSSDR